MWIADDRKLVSPYSQTFDFVGGDNGQDILKITLQISFLKTKTLGRYIVSLFVYQVCLEFTQYLSSFHF